MPNWLRRHLDEVPDWPWTDYAPGVVHSRYAHFLRSGEALTLGFLTMCALIFLQPGSTFALSPAFTWISEVSRGSESFWAVISCALAMLSPLALIWDKGLLRIMSVWSQGVYFLLFGISFRVYSPLGLGQVFFLVSGVWLLGRAITLWRHHWRQGGKDRAAVPHH